MRATCWPLTSLRLPGDDISVTTDVLMDVFASVVPPEDGTDVCVIFSDAISLGGDTVALTPFPRRGVTTCNVDASSDMSSSDVFEKTVISGNRRTSCSANDKGKGPQHIRWCCCVTHQVDFVPVVNTDVVLGTNAIENTIKPAQSAVKCLK